MKEALIWKLHAAYSKYYWRRLCRNQSLKEAIIDYKKVSQSTGAKVTTLYKLYSAIIKLKPKNILECGTGLSTIVICEAVLKIKEKDASYNPNIISMENNEYYHNHANEILPAKYKSLVEIIWGERTLYNHS